MAAAAGSGGGKQLVAAAGGDAPHVQCNAAAALGLLEQGRGAALVLFRSLTEASSLGVRGALSDRFVSPEAMLHRQRARETALITEGGRCAAGAGRRPAHHCVRSNTWHGTTKHG